MRKGCVFRSVCPDSENLKNRVGDHWMDSAAIGSSSMKLDNKRAPYAAGPLRQSSRLCIRVTMVRCLADIPEPRYSRVTGDDGLELSFPEPSPVRIEALEH